MRSCWCWFPGGCCCTPGWYQLQHASGAGERFEQLVVDQLTTLREQDQRWCHDVASCNAFLAQRLRPWLQRESQVSWAYWMPSAPRRCGWGPRILPLHPHSIGFRGWSWMEVELQGQQDGATCTALEVTRTRVGGLLPVPASSLGDVPTTITFPNQSPCKTTGQWWWMRFGLKRPDWSITERGWRARIASDHGPTLDC